MKYLSHSARQRISANGSLVYQAYAALNLATDFRGTVKMNGKYFSEYLQALAASSAKKGVFTHHGKTYAVTLEDKGDTYAVTIAPKLPALKQTKPLDEYGLEDALALWSQFPISMNKEVPPKLSLSFTANNQWVTIGGDKIDLYPIHIRHLYDMLERMKHHQIAPHTLFDMATGSGKSFTQALWGMVLSLAKVDVNFAVPKDALVKQLRRDFRRLLPDTICDQLDERIMTHSDLLMRDWTRLSENKDDLFLVIDEQHEAMREELFARRLVQLSKKYPCLFLSATPTDRVYDIVKEGLVELSRAEKEKQGMAKPAKNIETKAQRLNEVVDRTKVGFWQRLNVAIVESIESERTSPAQKYVEQVEASYYLRAEGEFHVQPKAKMNDEDMRRYLRWNLESPLGEKSLIHATQHDVVINLSILTENQHLIGLECPYKNGNRVDRYGVYQTVGANRNIDREHQQDHSIAHSRQRIELVEKSVKLAVGRNNESLVNLSVFDEVDFDGHARYLEHRIKHGIIEKTLSYLTGLDSVQLDRKRFETFDQLGADVIQRLNTIDIENIEDDIDAFLQKELNHSAVRDQINAMMVKTIRVLQQHRSNLELLNAYIDNWSLSKKLHQQFVRDRIGGDQGIFDQFIEKHRTLYLMRGLDKSETPIKTGVVYSGFNEHAERLDLQATTRMLSVYEQLNPFMQQYTYEPVALLGYQEETADALFKMGLVGSYITSEKTVGFNDPNLHNVGILIGSDDDSVNSPDMIVQAAGRNRGLNPARRPFCVTAIDNGVTISFNPSDLESANAKVAYRKAKKAHHQQIINDLKIKIASDIQLYIDKHANADGSLDQNALQDKCIELFIEGFDKVYNSNEHDFDKTRQEFMTMVSGIYKNLNQNMVKYGEPYQNPVLVKIIGTLLYVFSRIYLFFATMSSYSDIKLHLVKSKNDRVAVDNVYAHILVNYNLHDAAETDKVIKQIGLLLYRKTNDFALNIAGSMSDYLPADLVTSINAHFKQTLVPIFLRGIADPLHRALIKSAIEKRDDWLDLFSQYCFIHKDTLPKSEMALFSQIFIPLIRQDERIDQYIDENAVRYDAENVTLTAEDDVVALTRLAGDIASMHTKLNFTKIHQLLLQQYKPIIEDSLYKSMVKNVLEPLSLEQLTVLLEAMGHKEMAIKIYEYKTDLAKLSVDALLAKYIPYISASSTVGIDDLVQAFARINQIVIEVQDEILSSKKHFHRRHQSDKDSTKLIDRLSPALKAKQLPYGRTMQMSSQNVLFKASVDAYPALNRLKQIEIRTLAKHVAGVEGHLQDFAKGRSQKHGMFTTFAEELKKGKALSEADVTMSQQPSLSAVHKLRDAMRQHKMKR